MDIAISITMAIVIGLVIWALRRALNSTDQDIRDHEGSGEVFIEEEEQR